MSLGMGVGRPRGAVAALLRGGDNSSATGRGVGDVKGREVPPLYVRDRLFVRNAAEMAKLEPAASWSPVRAERVDAVERRGSGERDQAMG